MNNKTFEWLVKEELKFEMNVSKDNTGNSIKSKKKN